MGTMRSLRRKSRYRGEWLARRTVEPVDKGAGVQGFLFPFVALIAKFRAVGKRLVKGVR